MTKILIVDDDITITELMKALVKMEGHEPTTVNDSLQAMEIANSVQPDLITLI
jgi:DNA-binding response OmpR family regulator